MKTKKLKFDPEGYEDAPADFSEATRLRALNKTEIAKLGLDKPATETRIYSKGKLIERRIWGGARTGAGRKATGHVRLQLLVSPRTRQRIEALAKREHCTLSGAVERLAGKR